jgi:Na+/H+-dicarboxylate symporter/ABC-type amino acid transport substrate-binding protein
MATARTERDVPRPAAGDDARALSRHILFGVLAGAATGLFFGERTAVLQVVADAYVRLLQMTVLPYVTIAIITGLGALDFETARTIGKRVGGVIALLWAAALAAAFLVALIFPPHESASFFSAAMLEDRERFDFLGLYIPTNPFYSLANNVVPAVVLFSMAVGLALIAVPKKERLIEILSIGNAAIAKATNFIVSLTPYGVFAIAAVVTGTLAFETLRRLQVYMISYVGVATLLSLWVFPGLVAALTPVPYRAVMSRTRDALILAFMTTSLFAVLPLLTEETKALLKEYAPGDRHDDSLPEVIVPASFNFPHAGKLLSLSFVLFAAWFSDTIVPASEYLRLAGTGLLVLFGNVNAAIPFLLDMLRIPADTFRLFLTSGIVNARFGTLVAAVHTLTVALLGTCAVAGLVRFDSRRLLRYGLVTIGLTIVTVGGLRALLQFELEAPYDKDQVLANMQAIKEGVEAHVFRANETPPPLPAAMPGVIDRARARRVLRVGYFDDSLPYAFFNAKGDLVGFDVEMAHQLGRDLGLTLEFVPASRSTFDTGLDPAVCDLIMSGAAVTGDRALHVQYSSAYLDETVAFIVPDHLASTYSEWSTVRALGHVRIGVPRAPYFLRKVRDELTDVEIVPVDGMDDMFKPHTPPIDAYVATAERGAAYTILHPAFSAVVPKPRASKVPLAYIIAGRDAGLTSIVNTWIDLKRKDGTIDQLYSHWILGQDAQPRQPRWSIVRDVLHWMN